MTGSVPLVSVTVEMQTTYAKGAADTYASYLSAQVQFAFTF